MHYGLTLRSLVCAAPLSALASLVAPVQAAIDVRVVVTGVVERNSFTTGTFGGVHTGDPVTMTILLDSTNYLDSVALPGKTRGYRFNPSTFTLTIGSVTTTLRSVPAAPPAYFVVRNNDPRADGFFISQGTDVDVLIPLAMTPGGFGISFLRTFNSIPPAPSTAPDPTLTSVNILDAVGSWGLDNLSVYNFTIEASEISVPMIINYQTIAITALCPCAADFDGSGGTPDAGDIDAFFAAWLIGDSTADVDCSGGTPDATDIDAFFTQWLAGGC